MFDFHEKRKIRRILYSKPAIAFIFLLAIFMSVSTYSRFIVERDMAQKLQDHENTLNALKQRAQVLGTKVDHLENERGIEEELRNRFDVAKEGEKVVVILDDKNTTASTSTFTAPQGQAVSRPWYVAFKFW